MQEFGEVELPAVTANKNNTQRRSTALFSPRGGTSVVQNVEWETDAANGLLSYKKMAYEVNMKHVRKRDDGNLNTSVLRA